MFFVVVAVVVAIVIVVAMHKLIEIALYIFNYLVCVHSVLIKHVVLVLVAVVALCFSLISRVLFICLFAYFNYGLLLVVAVFFVSLIIPYDYDNNNNCPNN